MTRLRIILQFLMISAATTLVSCVDELILQERSEDDASAQTPPSVMVKSSDDAIVYDTLPNPYSLDVMQAVYDYYSETPVSLEPTDIYVKFMPKDSLELERLISDYNLELFDYPLNIELGEDEVYINRDLPETDLVWLYTTVSPDFVFPTGIAYEILEECYIPEDDETVGAPTKAGVVNVEDAAFALMGYDETPQVETRAAAVPQGTITVYDDCLNTAVPVKGVKIRCHRLVKWVTAYTNENGHYMMSKQFRFKPHYAIVFDNIKDFDIWGNWGPIARANYNLGWQSSAGYSVNIEYDDQAWQWAVVNNAAYEYYKMCEQTGILKPLPELKIWVWKNFCGGSAPMLRRITNSIGYNGYSHATNFIINMVYGATATNLNQTFKFVLPDITIGCLYTDGNRAGYEYIYQLVNHELSHASHFSKVGSSYWAKYISYIMTYGAYGGNDLGNNAQLCAIGEMWANFIGYAQVVEKFGYAAVNIDPMLTVDQWIYPQIFWELYERNILTKKQIYNSLTQDVDTYDELVSKFYTLYPDKSAHIEYVLSLYPNVHHNIAPIENGFDAYCLDQTVSSSMTISGDNILVEDTTIKNGAALTLNVGSSLTIYKPLIVSRGADLIINNNITE